MQNLWNNADFQRSVDGQCSANDIPAELAELVYASRLLGSENSLVMHGGGNTSVKSELHDIIGNRVNVIFIKGSGVDLAALDAHDFTPVRIEPLQKLQNLYVTGERHSDEDIQRFSTREFKNFLYLNLFYLTDHMVNNSLSPSIETLLHAFLPHRFIFHTHSTALLTLSNQPDGESLCRETLGDLFGMVPYIKPGLGLARSAAEAYGQDSAIRGLVLQKHGLVTFADTAAEAYGGMIESVTKLEERIARSGRKHFFTVQLPRVPASLEVVAPVIRGAVTQEKSPGSRQYDQFVLDFRSSPDILDYVNSSNLAEVSGRGAMTPDFVIRTKNRPLIVPAPDADDLDGFKAGVIAAVDRYTEDYRSYFERQKKASGMQVAMLDPLPRVVLVPGLGLFGLGRTAHAAAVNADIAASTASAILDAESVGRFESITERDAFDIEYWEMEQAKMKKVRHDVFAGKVVLVTGAASGIGLATAKAFRQKGAELVILDLNPDALEVAAKEIGEGTLVVACDVTDRVAVRNAFDTVCRRFGGVDIVVSNVGVALQGRIGDVADELLRRSFELNFFSHQAIAQEAVRIMRLQGTGGALLFNVSKQAVNPGPDFGPYGLPKAATMFLVRQYALDHGRDGIRANGINADRIRTGLLTEEMIRTRSKARGLSEREYMAGNLLQVEVTAEDVAEAFVHQALETKTTGSIVTVDGGNIAAALR
ncbi:MAG: bifunctional aldolase/short-chain dehydrogenase [Chlorobium sp.]|jgi:rhamnose utilization protein RhaD (predicted bifunctional aldolase and dehydrogenase)/NAD(P)-dependent dehydrogenase (short-subunit alcohol dehydrogenase family)|uniref:bifunctional aldolase/short-chain dehydrogenase n=1 Tax=Chlorobium sp. TaxID=1095 RepID=UPI0025BC1CE3|nr:bifunctional aldolase/short-chain dehydrogenase [Chlorobium sp.]MCF8215243.1 bifunctional aldolase/short-chain dehydrogenase [Chlorobium sp.]MCF8270078.1 bifunctional aldolase/short-chain dehydrogenase [Chlorobium sp.]MCF8286449.1 bifunctional aldolase/short-chain dehydrogenase [Chlorobium sp.]MCF8290047.1 bifunctional aldolase/short-chain dehydrogenase [Chlorobium sp.]MCF8384118.1 bifunctional aldolase/short-chain dehydrogenase [Chlorobium sp.]